MSEEMSRRSFLKVLTVVGATAAALPALTSGAGAADPKYVAVGKTSEFKVGEFKKVVLDAGPTVFVTRLAGEEVKYLALSSKCTHKGCDVLWLPAKSEFRCPCHGGLYDTTGKVVSGPPKQPLPAYPNKVADGKLYIQV